MSQPECDSPATGVQWSGARGAGTLWAGTHRLAAVALFGRRALEQNTTEHDFQSSDFFYDSNHSVYVLDKYSMAKRNVNIIRISLKYFVIPQNLDL